VLEIDCRELTADERLVHEGVYDTSTGYIQSVRDYYHPRLGQRAGPKGEESVIKPEDLVRLR